MTKAEWISVIKNTLRKIDEQGVFFEPFLERHIQSVYEQMYNELYKTEKKTFSKYTSIVTEDVLADTSLADGRTIPTLPISLPRENGGVFDFYVGDDRFILTSYEGFLNAKESRFDTAGMKGVYLASVINNKIYADYSTGGAATLSYRIIPKFTALASTAEVIIPMGMEDHFIDRVIMTVQQIPPTDLINDNTIQ